MKKLTISLLLLCSIVGYTQASQDLNLFTSDPYTSIITDDNQLISLKINMSDLEIREIIKGNTIFNTCTILGEGMTCDNGKPILPAISRFVVVPPNAGLELVVKASEPRIVKATNPPEVWDDEDLKGCTHTDLPNNSIYPSVIAEMGDPIVIRGVRLVKVTSYPVRYDFSTDSYLHYDHIQTDVRFTNEEPVNPASYPNRRYRSAQFLKVIEALAINGENIRRDEPDDEIPPYVGHYLIVTNENCLEYAAPFIEWRRKSGYKVDILSLSSNDAGDPGEVEDAIQDYYDMYLDENIDPFDYILLIGDRSGYYGSNSQWELDSFDGESLWQNYRHADYKYACLEGNDNYPDVGISRWPNGSRDLMELVIGKTLAYETDPPMDDPDWFNKTGVYSQHWGNAVNTSWHPSIHTTVRWGVEVLESLGFEDVDAYEEFDWDQQGQSIGPWIRDHYNDGTNILIGRAQNYYWRNGFNGVDDNTVFTVDLNIGHFPWTSENSFRTGDGDHLKGPVAITYCYSEPSVMTPMNLVWLNLIKGVLLDDLPLGWGRTYAVTAFELSFPDIEYRNEDVYLQVKTDYGCFSDPGLQPWIGVPTAVDIEFPEHLSPEARGLTVHVTNHEDNEDLAGAQVTIYNPGDMPDPDSDDYATYDEMFMMTTTSDDVGIARFVFPEDDELEPGTMYVTVSGRDICPEFGEIAVEQTDLELSISRYSLMEIAGNDDDDINPGESFIMLLYAKNLGSEDTAEDVTAELSSNSPWIEDFGDDLGFDDIEPGDEEMSWGGVEIDLSPSCPDAASRPLTNPVIDILLTNGDETWYSAIKLNPVAPNLEVSEIIGDNVIGLDQTEIDIELENVGGMDMPEFEAELVALEYGVSVTRSNGDYPEIRTGETSQLDSAPFLVAGSALTIPGTRVEMALILSNEDDFVDTAYFELQVREPEENVPTGPDDYGYSCFDDTDNDWLIAPDYEWIEICPEDDDADFQGTLLEFEGRSENDIGEAIVIDLGYTLVFYGQEYDQITVATNGFISVGEQERIVNFENWPLDRCIGGGMGMIAPFWDDLQLDDGGVYYFHNEDDGRFIIEWYKIRHNSGGNTDLIFQVILYDGDMWPTVSGDDKILFQYRSIDNTRNLRNGDDEWLEGIPYASVGISSPDGSTGINYTWNNEYPISGEPLEPARALLFTTALFDAHEGLLSGRVTDAANGEPLEGVNIATQIGQNTTSDDDGYWQIDNAFTGFEFDLTFFLEGYNDSVVTDLFLDEMEELTVDVALLHPEFVPSQWSFVRRLMPNQTTELDFTVENSGNGPFDWELSRHLPWGPDADPWEHRVSYAVSDTVGDPRIEGVVFAENHFYVSGSNSNGDEPMIYVLDREGNEVDRFPQIGESRFGMKDLAWDGELIWGCAENMVIGFTTDGDSVTGFEGPEGDLSAIAWDSDREVLWIARRTGRGIYAMKTDGSEVDSLRLPRYDLRLYGLAYWRDAPDGNTLYAFHNPDNNSEIIHKINPDTQDTTFVRALQHEDGYGARGAFCTNQFDVYSWVFICIADNNAEDRIGVWQLEARRDWFRVFMETDNGVVAAEHGRIDAEEIQEYTLQLSSDDLPELVEFNGFLVFRNDVTGRSPDTLSVLLEVVSVPYFEFNLLSPADGDTLWENPSYDTTLVSFSWEPVISYNQENDISYQVWFKSGGDSVMIESGEDTTLILDMIELTGDLGLPLEEEWLLEWYVIAAAGDDTTRSFEIFTLHIIPDAIITSGNVLPVEFGLQSIYPSPFNAVTTISFGIDVDERAKLQIYDLAGRRVAALLDGNPTIGYHSIAWNASSFPSGLYFVRLESAGRIEIAKVALIR